ncbi:MAG: hypothetical protein AB7U73_08305 [Pirellulales bacterium]
MNREQQSIVEGDQRVADAIHDLQNGLTYATFAQEQAVLRLDRIAAALESIAQHYTAAFRPARSPNEVDPTLREEDRPPRDHW